MLSPTGFFWGMTVITASFIILPALRFYVLRHKLRNKLALASDSFFLFAAVLSASYSIFLVIRLWIEIELRKTVKDEIEVYWKLNTPIQLGLLFLASITYLIIIWSVKAAFLCLYWQLYTRTFGWRRYALHTVSGVIPLTFVVVVAVYFSACRPLRLNWLAGGHGCSPTFEGYVQTLQTAINISTDLLLVVLPLIIINSLQLSRGDMYAMCFVFLIAFTSVSASIVRYAILDTTGSLKINDGVAKVTMESIHLVELLSLSEILAAMIAFSLPSFRFLLQRPFHFWAKKKSRSDIKPDSQLGSLYPQSFVNRGSDEEVSVAVMEKPCELGMRRRSEVDTAVLEKEFV